MINRKQSFDDVSKNGLPSIWNYGFVYVNSSIYFSLKINFSMFFTVCPNTVNL